MHVETLNGHIHDYFQVLFEEESKSEDIKSEIEKSFSKFDRTFLLSTEKSCEELGEKDNYAESSKLNKESKANEDNCID